MGAYIVRRILYTVPIWLGVYLITFLLFHIRDPLTIARVHLPQAPVTALQAWARNNGFHLPLFINLPSDARITRVDGKVHKEFADHGIFYSQFFLGLRDLTLFEFGTDKNKQPIAQAIKQRVGPSLSIMVPSFVLTLLFSIVVGLFVAYFRETTADITIVITVTIMMSIAMPAYLVGVNFLFGHVLRIVPVYNSVLLPIFVAFVSGISGQIRFFRAVFLDQMNQDYVRTARAKGVGEARVLARHVLRNSLIPILTSVVMSLPFLITGSLLLEQFFGIPGMGDMMFTAVVSQDFQVIRVIVYLGSFLYMLGSLLTDISYTIADPRVVLK
ncbi:MAG: ABC transporter permease [Spirochaetia bacterium]|nr:ABC transporter permease [Spirochaetia bacterium]